jgi:benzoate 4-monooxygenase
VASKNRGLFNTRDRAEHTRKRKIVSHTFAPKSVREFHPYITNTVAGLLRKYDALCEKAEKNPTASASQYGERMKGWAVLNTLDAYNALAFDIIGDLAFGEPFGMIDRDFQDTVEITREDGSTFYAPAVQILNERGEVRASFSFFDGRVRD